MAFQTVLYDVKDGVATLTMNRPEKLNAFNGIMLEELTRALDEIYERADIRVVVLTGAGRAFSAGADFEWFDMAKFAPLMRVIPRRVSHRFFDDLEFLEKPVIAAINGIAAGAGAVLALASDFRIMADTARFAFLFTKVGLAGADMGAAFLLPQVVGFGRATELLMLGDTIDAPTAERYGLAYRVVPADRFVEETRALARRLADGPTQALGMTKRMLNNEWGMDLVAAIEAEAQAQALLLMAEDHKEFYRAFTEKRPPRFTGR